MIWFSLIAAIFILIIAAFYFVDKNARKSVKIESIKKNKQLNEHIKNNSGSGISRWRERLRKRN